MQVHYQRGDSVDFVVHVTNLNTIVILKIPTAIMLCEV